MNPGCEALVASLRQRATEHVRKASRSNNLRDIVRLVTMASMLEHAARKLCAATEVNLSDIARLLGPVAAPEAHFTPESAHVRPADSRWEDAESMSDTYMAVPGCLSETASRTEILNLFILRRRNAAQSGGRVAPPTGRPETK